MSGGWSAGRRIVVVTVFAGLVTFADGGVARAQPVIPTPPEEVTTLLAPLTPALWPACANVLTGTTLLVALGPLVAPDVWALIPTSVIQQTAPVVALCGGIPRPEGRRRCGLDAAIVSSFEEASGSAFPLVFDVEGMAVDQTLLVLSTLGVPPVTIAQAVDPVLGCAAADVRDPARPVPSFSPTSPAGDQLAPVEREPLSEVVDRPAVRGAAGGPALPEQTLPLAARAAAGAPPPSPPGLWPAFVTLAVALFAGAAALRRSGAPGDAHLGVGRFIAPREGRAPTLR